MKNIPNLFTLLNLFFGCIAVIFTLQTGLALVSTPEGTQYVDMPEKMGIASLFIGAAALVDFLDGLVARMFKATSPMGKQLDSLADVVSFGVAPGMILYQFLRISFARQQDGFDISPVWFLPALLIPCAAAFRLAKFNVDESQTYGFKGVPTPAAGLVVASIPLIYWYTQSETVTALLLNKWVLYGVIVVLAWLMVSNLPLMALKFTDYTIKTNLPKLILLALAIVSAVFLKWLAVPVVFIFYIIVSLLSEKKSFNRT
ncbi:MAG: CDP-alcohol phosphatidyltransferase [Sphingobacteriales bacterium 50-39]|nr:CDP-alcohol phosphatidyltransferase family protein [Sphingobacteriales bacterium]OJW56103.1 MAG: CDP-alcohol phosphatidyltransferase [Sphingobacteriales bacterium 50-39]